ncbi:hypothetical protein BSFP_063700 [Burkholderia stabilis]|uniref:Uncharacterized protein n=1 Tax=Burkholderia stabilis TaxID=95485 RepID=A0A1Y1C0E0_9BURK|nr:hypothetical protein BSFP_063700 [Burkholderia stabilis]
MRSHGFHGWSPTMQHTIEQASGLGGVNRAARKETAHD